MASIILRRKSSLWRGHAAASETSNQFGPSAEYVIMRDAE